MINSTVHSAVLPRIISAPAVARLYVTELAKPYECKRLIADALIVVTEVIQNVAQHTNGNAEMLVLCDPAEFTIAVADTSPAEPRVIPPSTSSRNGRGMFLVDQIAYRWGFWRVLGGKIVWVQLRHPTTTA